MSSPYYSDCCGAQATGEMMDYGICPECKEHCDFELQGEDEPIKKYVGEMYKKYPHLAKKYTQEEMNEMKKLK